MSELPILVTRGIGGRSYRDDGPRHAPKADPVNVILSGPSTAPPAVRAAKDLTDCFRVTYQEGPALVPAGGLYRQTFGLLALLAQGGRRTHAPAAGVISARPVADDGPAGSGAR